MESEGYRLRRPVTEADWTRGPQDAPLTFLEYIDFQCSCCQGSYPIIEQLMVELGDQVRFAIREFPVTSTHQYAEDAARAAEAAGRQGKFWEMYARLIQAQSRLSREELEFHAHELGLDLDRFRQDRDSEVVREKIKHDKYFGMRTGVNGTPTIFINGFRFEGAGCPVQEDELREALEAALLQRATSS